VRLDLGHSVFNDPLKIQDLSFNDFLTISGEGYSIISVQQNLVQIPSYDFWAGVFNSL
jgi:hypothetical protein